MFDQIACELSARASRVIASPWALPGYVVGRIILQSTLPINTVTLILSDFANAILLLMAIEAARQSNKMEHGIDELVRVEPALPEKLDG